LPWELIPILTLVAALNRTLPAGTVATAYLYEPGAVGAGEWWRLVLHPFVHVGIYHLLLDTLAFAILYASVELRRAWRRLLTFALCAGGALAGACLAGTAVLTHGYCGLSGAAHGLMAVYALGIALDSTTDHWTQRMGIGFFILLVAKSLFEALTGQVALSDLHFGAVGAPIATAHAGGVLGGLAAWSLLSNRTRGTRRHAKPERCG